MVNYIHLINWFWEDVPYREGYKSEYGCLFLALVDSINRNGWRSTRIEYDRIINKVRVGKRMYYEALKWLQAQDMLTYKAGRNEYAAAEFDVTDSLKAEVQKRTATDTSTAPLPDEAQKAEVQKGDSTTPQVAPLLHRTDTAASTSTAPIIDKPLNSKTEKELNNKPLNEEGDTRRENAPPAADGIDSTDLAKPPTPLLPQTTPSMLPPSAENGAGGAKSPIESSGKQIKGEYGDGVLHEQCIEYAKLNSGKYTPTMYKAFLAYWTAIVQNGTKAEIGKELWRTQKTFDLSGRLSTWKQKDDNYTKPSSGARAAASQNFLRAQQQREPAGEYGI